MSDSGNREGEAPAEPNSPCVRPRGGGSAGASPSPVTLGAGRDPREGPPIAPPAARPAPRIGRQRGRRLRCRGAGPCPKQQEKHAPSCPATMHRGHVQIPRRQSTSVAFRSASTAPRSCHPRWRQGPHVRVVREFCLGSAAVGYAKSPSRTQSQEGSRAIIGAGPKTATWSDARYGRRRRAMVKENVLLCRGSEHVAGGVGV